MTAVAGLQGSDRPLVEVHDAVLFDLDGVVYAGSAALPGAPEAVARVHRAGVELAYVTNNAARPPHAVAARLSGLGVPAAATEVVTSAQAAARLLAEQVPAGSNVLVVGGEGLVEALGERGLTPVFEADAKPAAVVQGFHPDLGWKQLAEGAYALAEGLPWVASNTDRTLPTDRGFAPGNGTLVEALKLATGRTPRVAGKPERPVFDEALVRTGARKALVVGDRLDTDIEGARNADLPSLLVLTGVSTVRDLLLAPPARRPTYVASDLQGLFAPHARPVEDGASVRCGRMSALVEGRKVRLVGEGAGDADPTDSDRDDAVRALATLAWGHADPAGLDFDAVPLARQ